MSDQVPYPAQKGTDRVTETCGKCLGKGRLAGTRVDGGRCWACMGTGSRSVLVSSVRARARRQEQQAANEGERRARVRGENRAAIAALCEAYPPFAGELTSDGKLRSALASEAVADVRQGGTVTDAVWRYRYMTGEIVDRLRPNRYRGQCHSCGAPVAAEEGWVGQTAMDGWHTYCAEHPPES